MKKIKCVVINQDNFENISNSLNEKLQIKDVQSYFPILSLFFRFYNNSNKNFTLKMNNYIVNINDKINIENNDSYIKNFYNCSIKNFNTGNITEKKVFFKILPLLNVSQYMMNEYSNETSLLPNIFSYLTTKKLNNYHNSAYIDSFFSYLASNLTESGSCPTFPIFYGTFNGIAKEFKSDITEEYSLMKNQDWFDFFKNRLFTIEKSKINFGNNKKSNKDEFDFDINLQENDLEENINTLEQNENTELNEDTLEQNEITLEQNEITLEQNENENTEQNEITLEQNENEDTSEQNEITSEQNEITSEQNEDTQKDPDDTDDSDSNWSDISSSSNSDYDNMINDIKLQKVEFGNNNIEINSVSSLSASICSDISFSSIGNNEVNFVKLYDFPVQLNCIEMLDKTLDNYLDEYGKISDLEWKSILFQVCFGLAVAQKKYNFVHNDLHSSNIMFKNTDLEYLYFNFKGKYFKIPTFGKISKIIDFGRATFNVGNNLFFSDVFKKNGDAEGQYSFPYNNSLNNCKIKPNKSFDLSRLATTIIEHFDENNSIYKLLKLWCSDKYGNFLMKYEDDFNLYKKIAKNVTCAVPKDQINKMIFKEFIIEKEDINNNEFIYCY